MEQLVVLLAEARRSGEQFEQAWTRAVRPDGPLVVTNSPRPPVGAVRWSSDNRARKEERVAIEATRDAWERAYRRMPATSREVALIALEPWLTDLAAAGDRAAAFPALSAA